MKFPLIFILMFLFGFNIAFSQTTTNSENELNSSKKLSLEEEMEGTYQIVVNDSKITEVFTTDIFKVIESKREDNRDVTFWAGKYTSIIVFSREKINSQEFKNRKK